MNAIDKGGCGRLCLSKSRKWLLLATLLGMGITTTSIWAQGSETRFGFLERQTGFRQGYGVYSTTAFPAVNTYGFKHAAVVVDRGTKVALLSSSSSTSVPSGAVNTGSSVPPPNLMVVSGRSASRPAATPAPKRRLFARRTESGTTRDGLYILSRTRGNPPKAQTSTIRKTTSYSQVPGKKRVGLRNLFRKR